MFQIILYKYQKDGFFLDRNKYYDLPQSLEFKEGDLIEQADDEEQEFLVHKIVDEEVHCTDINIKIKRYFYKDSCRLSAKDIQRKKRALALKKKQENYERKQENKKTRAQRSLLKLKRKEDKKNKKFKFSKKKEKIIKFV